MKKKLQIDVIGEVGTTSLIECKLLIDGSCITKFFITESDYHRLIDEGFFLRQNSTENCGVINTTKVYSEQ